MDFLLSHITFISGPLNFQAAYSLSQKLEIDGSTSPILIIFFPFLLIIDRVEHFLKEIPLFLLHRVFDQILLEIFPLLVINFELFSAFP